MNKKLFDLFDDMFDDDNPEFEDCNPIERHICSDEREELLTEMAKKLSGDDISFILSEHMKYHNIDKFATRSYDESTGSKLLHFRMEAEYGYYLDDLEGDENE